MGVGQHWNRAAACAEPSALGDSGVWSAGDPICPHGAAAAGSDADQGHASSRIGT
jgi:hypothetical protein